MHDRSLVDLLRRRAHGAPDAPAYAFLADGETESARLDYAALERRARALGAALQAAGGAGERALLLFPQGLDFVAAFLGCLFAGAVAVPAYPPRNERGLPRLAAILGDARPRVVLTTAALLDAVRPSLEAHPAAGGVAWIAADAVDDAAADGWRDPGASPSTLAFLQYTSGSTATPRGVMVSHGNLLHNLELLRVGWRQSAESVVVSWLPLFHDMGLIGAALESLYLGAPCILLSPATFLQRPFCWLRAVSRYRATLSGGPNFAYDLCVRRITPEQRATLDLSCWHAAFNGAEPVRRDTLERFHAAFAPCGLRRGALHPGYGLAEATLAVSSGHAAGEPPLYQGFRAGALEANRLEEAKEDGDARVLVGCGFVLGRQRVAIVDPERRTGCAPDEVGEIWVRGPSVALGYWERPEETEKTFGARLADTGEGPFLRTGDLGFVHRGELFVTGRIKDLVILDGRNLYPQDLELAVETSHPAVRAGCAAAFALETAGGERLGVAAELDRHAAPADAAKVVAAIRGAVAAAHDVPVHTVALLRTGGIPKTTSGKIQRRACRAALLDGSLAVVHRWSEDEARSPRAAGERAEEAPAAVPLPPPAAAEEGDAARVEEIRRWLVARVAGHARVAPEEIDPRRPFAEYGVGSLAATTLSGELEEWLGRRLPPTLLYDHPTADRLARHLAGAGDPSPSPFPSSPPSPAGRDADRVADEPIAIVGMGCRFPGAEGPRAFWRLLRGGVDAVEEVPGDRWDVDAFYDPEPKPGRMTTRRGGFVRGVDRFDAAFFGIAPREAARMDPQQRLLLEVAWEALEDAGIDVSGLAGTAAGVFVGISTSDYGQLQFTDPALGDAYAGTGGALSIAANRLSYVLDLRGPSLAVDTACSSSLVALHLACASLRAGECELALAGGANLLLSPNVTVNFSQAGFMAPDGRCKAFDAAADGYVRGEGAGVVVLKPLSRALADGDRVHALVLATAVNQDGRSNGLTAPNGGAQEAVLREAYRRAGVAPAAVQYVEAHGTGTALGDPIEARALGAVVGAGRDGGPPCRIGSVKTNIGHLEAAAGIAGVIKVALALCHRRIPPSLHFRAPNPAIAFDELGLAVETEGEEWPAAPGQAVAGVSSFGFGGTNAHAVLAEAPAAARVGGDAGDGPVLVALSARSAPALAARAAALGEALADGDPADALRDVGWTAALRRTHLEHRLAVAAQTRKELVERLGDFAAGRAHPAVHAARRAAGGPPRVAFVCGGQGPQWWAMGRELLAHEPAFRAAVEECDARFAALTGEWRLLDELRRGEAESRLGRTDLAQPALFALQVALAALWESRGVRPDCVAGHSIGEAAAACIAGALSPDDAARLVFHRGRLMHAAAGQGAMAAVSVSPAEAGEIVARFGGRLSVAAWNAPRSVTLSGERTALDEAVAALEARGASVRRLAVDYAFHSAQMAPAADELARVLDGLSPREAAVPFFSTVLGRRAEGRELDAAYWGRNVRDAVRFSPAVEAMAAAGAGAFVELGPHPVLAASIRATLDGAGAAVLPSLRRGEPERATFLAALGALHCRGVEVDWRAVYPGGGRLVSLPPYPWERERHWLAPTAPPALRGARCTVLAEPAGAWLWESDDAGALADASPESFAALAVAAATQAAGPGAHAVESIDLAAAADADPLPASIQLILRQDGEFRLFGSPSPGREWRLRARGRIRISPDPQLADDGEAAAAPASPEPPGLLRERVLATEGDGRAAALEAYLRAAAARVLRLDGARVEADRPLLALGLDSLMAVELGNRVRAELGVAVPLRDLLGGASPAALAAALLPALAAAPGHDAPEAAADEAGPLPLMPSQRAMWVMQQLHPGTALFNVFAAIRITSPLDADALERALRGVAARHPALRTVFRADDGRPVQEPGASAEVALARVDASGWDDARLERALADDAHRPFELESGPPLRAALYARGAGQVLLVSMHHLATDFWSNVLFLRDLAALYAAETGAAPAAPAPPELGYAEAVRRAAREPADAERLWAYWSAALPAEPPVLALPADRARPAQTAFAGAAHRFRVDAESTARLKALAVANGTTLYVVLLAAWEVLLARAGGRDEVLVASPMAGRDEAALEGVFGCFMNPVLLRGDLSGRPDFARLVARTREAVAGALQHQAMPLHLLAQRLPALREAGRGQPFQAMFIHNRPHRLQEAGIAGVMLGEPGVRFAAGGLEMESLPLEERTSPCDLCLWTGETDGGISARLQYSTELLEAETAHRLARAFATLLAALPAAGDAPVDALPLLSADERDTVVAGWGDGGAAIEADVPVHARFEAAAARTPDAAAVLGDGAPVTYAELNRRANRLAHHLRRLGAGPEGVVGVCLERSAELVAALLAVLKAGAAYVPLDPAYPAERLETMVRDCGARLLVTRRGVGADLPAGAAIVDLDADRAEIAAASEGDPGVAVDPAHLAYVIYTSGSTGTPKGVMVPHGALANHTASALRAYQIAAADRVLQFASPSFDASAEEIYPALAAGAALVPRPARAMDAVAEFLAFCRHRGVTVLDLPTAYWHQVAAALEAERLALPPTVRLVIIGGERALPERVAAWNAAVAGRARLVNSYGPTEATIVATRYDVAREEDGGRELPVGTPIDGARCRVLDAALQPVPAAIPGELYLGGAGLARGYLGRPALTAERFVPDPWAAEPGARMYATGDRARWREREPEGACERGGDPRQDARALAPSHARAAVLEFLARIDDQVKVRGFRVEPGEIEAALRGHPDVRDAAVVAREDAPGERSLAAYVVARAPAPPAGELRDLLRELLPPWMVPSSFACVDALPLTQAGKVDRRALAARPAEPAPAGGDYVAPRTPAEEALAAAWCAALRVERVGVHDNFFELGGDSIRAIQAVADARRRGVFLTPHQIFLHPTVARAAAVSGFGVAVESLPAPADAAPEPADVPQPVA